jgi:hypothetical protein
MGLGAATAVLVYTVGQADTGFAELEIGKRQNGENKSK